MEEVGLRRQFSGIYYGLNVLITGNTGFKGAWLAYWLKKLGAKVHGFSVDIPTKPSLFELMKLDYTTLFSDVRDRSKLESSIRNIKPDIIFHLAAQSLVRKSYADPLLTYEVNAIGTLNLFEAARKCESVKAVINVTTDKVYEYSADSIGYSENDPLGGHDPYSASKACSEIISASYRNSFLPGNSFSLATVRAGNVIGGGDWAADRLIPDLVKAASSGAVTQIRYPHAIRPWQHVLEPVSGYLLLGQKLLEGNSHFASAWNFGPDYTDCREVERIADLSKEIWNDIRWEKDPLMSLHESPAIFLDSSKAATELHWSPVWRLEDAVRQTINWYKEYFVNGADTSSIVFYNYIEDAKHKNLIWQS
ncbi:MAG: CDP-glucose 4,6-dehydratase [Bacteroidetes bacterium]|nr:MAG: CDP-glucose 4,6-dehydratase [Bacteroidota bacterium]REJ99720.1 MAG: CDP-glucose 4,6-dehydratase [Bacteroidota bacterium]REK32914.1 MAG: CDP-glucose 4,6-dehydratase [Bacteroidota bacterium]REK47719.1 MAG: CDP-glucose 4,6-dehydratase [Bacteroidota bacterium]